MSSPNLPDGAFFTTINGRRCTAIPKEGATATTTTRATTTTTTPDQATQTPPQRQPTPPADEAPPSQQPVQDPPQRDPPQAEPPRQTPINRGGGEDAASTARTETSPSPSSPRVDVSRPTIAPIPPTQDGQNTPEADLLGPTPTNGAGSLITTGPFPPGAVEGDQAGTTVGVPGISGIPAGSSSGSDGPSGLPVAAIVGGVVGGVAFLTMLALLLWFWKKNRRRRRSTLLTPLSTNDDGNFGSRKGRPYIFDQESVGPTPKAARFRAALGYNFQRVRGQVGGMFAFGHDRNSGSVLSKDNSQYSNMTERSRDSSLTSPQGAQALNAMTTKDRLMNWKERLGGVALFRGRGRHDKSLDPDPFASVREKEAGTPGAAPGTQPDFLTLLGMDEKAVEREAHRRRASRRHGSTASMERFLGDLGINIDNNANPFADANALPEEPKRAAPVNPFADSNAIAAMAMKPGTNYINDVRRSRNLSMGGLTTRPPSIQGVHSPRYDSVYRASGESVESFATRRNRCRSDPFDLERPELLGGSTGGPSPSPRRPGAAHMRSDSFASKYSSGINSAGWSEPGPDVGTDAVVGGRFSPNSGWRPGAFPGREDRSRMSGGSQESRETQKTVGKAM